VVDQSGETVLVADQNNQRIRKIHIGHPPDPKIALRMYAGLTIEGVVNSVYRIEYNDSLDAVDWKFAAVLSLPWSSYLWIDEESSSFSKRFYRAILVP
jgi:hypothetical protein